METRIAEPATDPREAPPAPPQPLVYQRSEPGVTRGAFRLLLLLTAMNTMLLGWFVLGPQLHGFVREQWAAYQQRKADAQKAIAMEKKAAADRAARVAFLPTQEAAMRYSAAEEVIYQDEADAQRRVAAQSAAATQPVGAIWPGTKPPPSLVGELGRSLGRWNVFSPDAHVLFLHERSVPGGGEGRLVVVLVSPSPSTLRYGDGGGVFYPRRRFTALTINPGTADRDAAVIAATTWEWDASTDTSGRSIQESKKAVGASLKLYAGQPDPAAASRLTIRYDIAGKQGEIVGLLNANGQVHLQPTGVMAAGWKQE